MQGLDCSLHLPRNQNNKIMMTREQAEIILDGMSLDECIKMWNESGADHYCRSKEIHECEDNDWWTYLSNELGAYYLVWDIQKSAKEGHFTQCDWYFFYDDNDCLFYSFDDKDGLMKLLGIWFIEELINR